MTYTVSSGTLNLSIPYHTIPLCCVMVVVQACHGLTSRNMQRMQRWSWDAFLPIWTTLQRSTNISRDSAPSSTYRYLPCVVLSAFLRNKMPLVIVFPSLLWHCWFGNRKGIQPVESWVLVCWWWQFDWSLARIIVPVVTTTSIILSSTKIQNEDIQVPERLNWRERDR